MQFGSLTAFWWALLAVPVVVFYILKIRLRRVPVSTVMFWNQIFEEKKPRSIWQQLRHLVSLLVQLAILALVVLALADPFLPWEMLQARRIVLVVDHSAGMRATDADGAADRLAQAKTEGMRLIDGLRQRDEMAIIAAGSVPRVTMGLTSHQRTLRDALSDIPATDGRGTVEQAVALGRRLLAGHKNGQIVVLTDGCFPAATKLAEQEDVRLVLVGQKTPNVGITQFQVRRSLVDPIGFQILVEVTNFSDDPATCRLDIDLADRVVDVVPLKLEPGERWSHVIDQTAADGGRLVARLDVKDRLAADNQAIALLPKREKQPVVLLTEGNLFLQKVFEAIPVVDLKVTEDVATAIPSGAVAVYHRRLPEKLPDGDILVIDPQASTPLWTVGEAVETPMVTEQKTDSPLMMHVRLNNVLMPEARRLEFPGEHEVLLGAIGKEPLFVSLKEGRRRILVLTCNLDQGDLPLRTAFPILMTNAVNWFQGEKGELREALATGSVVEVELAPDEPGTVPLAQKAKSPPAALVLRGPDGTARPLPAGVARTHVGPLDHCGVWAVGPEATDAKTDKPAPALTEFACNLGSAEESDLRPPADLETTRTAGLGGWGGRPLWFYLTLAAFGIVVLEWSLYQRRWIS